MKVVIIGGVAGGAAAAARLRRLCEDAQIIMLEKGRYISFANCGLPYYIGGIIEQEESLLVQTPQQFTQRTGVEVRTLHEVLSVVPDSKTLRVKNLATGEIYTEQYDQLLLSPGAAPFVPSVPGANHEKLFTLRSIPDTLAIKNFIHDNHPRSAVVVGGGFIGLEMVENLSLLGIDVSIVEMADHLLPPLDYDMAAGVHRAFRKKGIPLYLNQAVTGFTAAANGAVQITLAEGPPLLADMVLLAPGVRPDTAFLASSGLAMNVRGALVVDNHMRTSDAAIYAVGDAVEVTHFVSGKKTQVPLAGPAAKQGRIAADNIAGIRSAYKGIQGSAVVRVFTLCVAVTGLNETAVKEAGLLYDKVYTRSSSHATYYPGAENMMIKLLFEQKTGRVLGAQLVGYEGVDKRCDILATAIRAGMTVSDLTELELCYAPPYSTTKDPVNIAGYAAENVLRGKVKQYYWEDFAKLPKDGSVILLDVRTPEEYASGHVKHTVSIPLDELRTRLQELNRQKPIYVTCQSGQRSYVACRILEQHGFTCYNFAGGFRLCEDIWADAKES